MSSRDWFWFLAGALITVAIMLIARAALRGRPAQTVRPAIPLFAVPLAAALALVGVALGVYFLLGSADSIASAHRSAAAQATAAARASGPRDDSPMQQASPTSTDAGSMDEVTQRLAARLASKGGSDSEWTLLAESYDY